MFYNKAILAGNLCRDPEVRHVADGTAVANFAIAVNRKNKTKAGTEIEEVLFMEVVAWGKLGELVGEYMKKGAGILVDGRLRTDSWTTEDGQKRNKVKLIAETIRFTDPPRKPRGPAETHMRDHDPTVPPFGEENRAAPPERKLTEPAGDGENIPF